jgi:hypothetical protein
MARVRSPNYPTLSLPESIERIRKVFAKEHRHKASPEVVAKAIGYTGLNGASVSAISALKKYGLLDEVGSDLQLSSTAMSILVDVPGSKERAEAITKAAFTPVLFQELKKQYGETLPSDDNVRSFLLKRGFAPSSVDAPIKHYRDTIKLVREANEIYTDASKGGVGTVIEGENHDEEIDVAIGDLVQWEAEGVLKLPAPRRVRDIKEHEGSTWIFVEDSETGIPMSEISVTEKASKAVTPPTSPLPPPIASQVAAGEREWLRGPLSRDSSYRLIVSGEPGPKEIGKLIKLLEAQKSVLSDEDPGE